MKNIYLITLFLFLVHAALTAQSYESYPLSQKVSINLTDHLLGDPLWSSEYALTYEHHYRPRWGFTGSLGYVGRNRKMQPTEGSYQGGPTRDYLRMNGISAAASLRYYFGQQKNRRWSVGPYVKYAWAYARSIVPEENELNLVKLKTTLNLAYQIEVLPNVEVEIYLGVGAKFRNYDWSDGQQQSSGNSSTGNLNRSWAISWTLIEQSSVAIATPLGLRVGYRF